MSWCKWKFWRFAYVPDAGGGIVRDVDGEWVYLCWRLFWRKSR